MPSTTPIYASSISSTCRRSVAALAVSQALWLLAAGGASAAAPVAQAANAARIELAIPAGTLEQVLVRFGQETGTMISYQAAAVAGKRSAGLAGSYSVPAALGAIVAGSGLRAVPQANGGYVLDVAAADGGQTMPEMKVSASADAHGATEGSGSYTTQTMRSATRLGLSVRETPQAVSVVTRQQMDDQNLQTVEDVLQNAAGVAINRYDSDRTSFFARGFSIASYQYDGIPTTVDNAFSVGDSTLDMTAYDRVEIVRGATGLLTGAGEPSATINLVRKRASSRQLAGNAALSLGSWNNARASADLSTPLSADGKVRGRVVASYQDSESYVHLYHAKKAMAYATIEADLAPGSVLIAGYEYQDNRPRGGMYGGLPLWYADGERATLSRSATTATTWSRWFSTSQTAFVRLEQELGSGWNLTAMLNHGWGNYSAAELFANTWPDKATGQGVTGYAGFYAGTRRQDSVDAYVQGPVQLLGRTHDLAFGVSGSNQFSSYPGIAGSSVDYGNFYQWQGVAPEPDWNDPSFSRWQLLDTVQQRGIYGTARFSLADPLKLIVGARYSRYKADHVDDWGGSYAYAKHAVTPYAGLVWDIDAQHALYTSYSKIFKPQGYQDRFGRYLDPVQGKNVEAGVKGEYFGGRLNAALAVFRIAQDGLAQEDTGRFVGNSLTQAYYAASGTTSKGVELDVSGELAKGWNVSASVSHAAAEDNTGARLNSYVPQTLARVFSTYQLRGDWRALSVGGGVNWQSGAYRDATGPTGTQRVEQGGYAVASLMAKYALSRQLSLQANINNVFDKHYYSQLGMYNQGYWGAPRNASVTLRYLF
ncbi:TonB-dependent siderophore receptor [Janthinobacterium sp. FW305-129]|uniref:TonB-dependent siderophore receptor n=1 Tax=Janthinobacterium sp. FW305-129 TaxID=2775054 RepID=UPI001E468607|nr:TonB-dependent receptor [Janthinobacterium sp. FW305-129]MCC7596445.1 TonB-dependent siderophore receptor [Janthinobacterium sp. FW305-129]